LTGTVADRKRLIRVTAGNFRNSGITIDKVDSEIDRARHSDLTNKE
jgi:hypothetical protein